jgi:hypothetical protein
MLIRSYRFLACLKRFVFAIHHINHVWWFKDGSTTQKFHDHVIQGIRKVMRKTKSNFFLSIHIPIIFIVPCASPL